MLTQRWKYQRELLQMMRTLRNAAARDALVGRQIRNVHNLTYREALIKRTQIQKQYYLYLSGQWQGGSIGGQSISGEAQAGP